jgi:hypothetical protein
MDSVHLSSPTSMYAKQPRSTAGIFDAGAEVPKRRGESEGGAVALATQPGDLAFAGAAG